MMKRHLWRMLPILVLPLGACDLDLSAPAAPAPHAAPSEARAAGAATPMVVSSSDQSCALTSGGTLECLGDLVAFTDGASSISRVPCMSYRGTADPPQTDLRALSEYHDPAPGTYFVLTGELRGEMIVREISSVFRGIVRHSVQEVYIWDRDSGMVLFGDGIHGRVPPTGSGSTADGPHDRYVAEGPLQGQNGEAGHIQLAGWLGEYGAVLDLTYHLVVCP